MDCSQPSAPVLSSCACATWGSLGLMCQGMLSHHSRPCCKLAPPRLLSDVPPIHGASGAWTHGPPCAVPYHRCSCKGTGTLGAPASGPLLHPHLHQLRCNILVAGVVAASSWAVKVLGAMPGAAGRAAGHGVKVDLAAAGGRRGWWSPDVRGGGRWQLRVAGWATPVAGRGGTAWES